MASDMKVYKYKESPKGPVYYNIMNSDDMKKELGRLARYVQRKSRGREYRTEVTVRSGTKRAHAYVLGLMRNPHSFYEHFHNRKYAKRLDILLQEALASLSATNR